MVCGDVVSGAGEDDPIKIQFLLWHGPLHPIGEMEYLGLLAAYQNAKSGTPLTRPNEPVNLRESEPL